MVTTVRRHPLLRLAQCPVFTLARRRPRHLLYRSPIGSLPPLFMTGLLVEMALLSGLLLPLVMTGLLVEMAWRSALLLSLFMTGRLVGTTL